MSRKQAVRHKVSAARWAAARERRRRLLAEWRQSGQSAAEFCRRRELAYTTFCGWRQRAARESAAAPNGSAASSPRAKRKTSGGETVRPSPPAAPVFVPLRWSGPAAALPPVEIGLRNGRTLRVPWACEPETAARWAAALEAARPC